MRNAKCEMKSPDAGCFAHNLVRSVELGVRSEGALRADYKAVARSKKLKICDSLFLFFACKKEGGPKACLLVGGTRREPSNVVKPQVSLT